MLLLEGVGGRGGRESLLPLLLLLADHGHGGGHLGVGEIPGLPLGEVSHKPELEVLIEALGLFVIAQEVAQESQGKLSGARAPITPVRF